MYLLSYIPIYLFIYHLIYQSVCLSMHERIYSYIYLSICLSISIFLNIHQLVYLSVNLSTLLSIYPFAILFVKTKRGRWREWVNYPPTHTHKQTNYIHKEREEERKKTQHRGKKGGNKSRRKRERERENPSHSGKWSATPPVYTSEADRSEQHRSFSETELKSFTGTIRKRFADTKSKASPIPKEKRR